MKQPQKKRKQERRVGRAKGRGKNKQCYETNLSIHVFLKFCCLGLVTIVGSSVHSQNAFYKWWQALRSPRKHPCHFKSSCFPGVLLFFAIESTNVSLLMLYATQKEAPALCNYCFSICFYVITVIVTRISWNRFLTTCNLYFPQNFGFIWFYPMFWCENILIDSYWLRFHFFNVS